MSEAIHGRGTTVSVCRTHPSVSSLLHYQFPRPVSVTNAQQNVAQRVFSQGDE